MSDNPEDKVADLTVRVLREIRDEVRQTNARLDQTNAKLERGFDTLSSEMHQGFDLLGRRIDNLLLGEHRHELLPHRI